MVILRFIGMVIAIVMVVVSMNVGAMAGTSACAPQQHHSAGVQPGHDAAAGCHGMIDQDCCVGSLCIAAGVLAEAAMFMNPHQPADMPAPGSSDTLSGRLIAPETGPPRLPA